MFKEINKITKDVFSLAYSKGFYKLEKETPKKINDAYKELSKELN